ncbi:MAG: ATP-binding cassette domain-containing protein [Pseudonocardia sp.]|uniref:ATP-binding cassette domain-containing protein n=1 Tax=unclassified Pseudonocardia TaxID=2619320 RepID=UPI00086C938C|nr:MULTISPECIES: ATP-binding cassette domain-containing protein [unclassified Pseudonocardia]MBN9109741.1 ATP-binding cassette domain-containing protein [Pseudonocardia sp.]ODU26724.1 MAG: hypothetical protein ABS80_05990 [Pseudonocardia sp. SCN 72-51]ODV09153.1 MAG: hypothetical protein ABT15_00615 [Pseudonocardia sp. SCN 73-27]
MDTARQPRGPVFDDGLDLLVNVRDVVKRFGGVVALDHVGLRIRTGETHGIVGPTGAGKTTLMRIIVGKLRPDRGSARLLGTDPRRHAVELQRRVAYLPQWPIRWTHLTGDELLSTVSFQRGGDDARRAELIDRFSADTTTPGHADSPGNRQKIELVGALASGAELLVLDEPTRFLDDTASRELTAVLAEERRRGRTVLLTEDASSLADGGLAPACHHLTHLDAGRPVRRTAIPHVASPHAADRRLPALTPGAYGRPR